MSVKIIFDKNRCMVRIKQAWVDATPELSEMILEDCNKYCKEDTGALIQSSKDHSDLENGKIVWDTPYAHRQYWLITAKTEKNPNATWRWADVAKSKYLNKWTRKAQEGFTNNLCAIHHPA